MSKAHRGKGIWELAARGRGVCPVCKRENVKVLYEQETDGQKVKICKTCKAAISHGKKSLNMTAATAPAKAETPAAKTEAATPAPAKADAVQAPAAQTPAEQAPVETPAADTPSEPAQSSEPQAAAPESAAVDAPAEAPAA
ncbi:MAG: hypothetical protein LBG72_08275 [Spirochaetaceae bacterium]|jgi:hypothetical protein|nr:hypothetical protein [Spirochaetaceae bacterium]